MQLSQVRDILDAEVLCGADQLDTEVLSACGSDFMSDVLAFVKNQAMLLTGLVNPQVVRTADMMDMKCIVFVRGKRPDEKMLELAEAGFENIVCAQPFGCLPNHICGKGMIRKIKAINEKANIVPIDYDPSATRVNQENRIKLMLAVAKENLKEEA